MKKLLTIFCFVGVVGLLVPSSAKASILFMDHFNDPTLSGWHVHASSGGVARLSSLVPSPDGGAYLRLEARRFSDVLIHRNIPTIGFGNINVSGFYRTLSTGENTIDRSQFVWRKTGAASWNRVNLNSPKWVFNDLTLPNTVNNGSVDIGFYVRNGNDSSLDTLKFDALQIGGQSVAPEPASMLLLGSGLVGLVGFRRKRKI